jgi:thiosulfate/3-mercaptopyruvate sulfurtransferase
MSSCSVLRFALLAAVIASPSSAVADSGPLVSVSWLSAHLHDRGLVLLHVGDDYQARHIPGAQPMPFDVFAADRHGLSVELPDPAAFRARLAAAGVGDDSSIVVYAGSYPGSSRAMVHPASRLVFTLEAMGFDRVVLLDGGLAAWIAHGGPVSAGATAAVTGRLSVLAPRSLVVDAAFVKAHEHVQGFAIVDSRPAAAYEERMEGGGAGHVPGAISIPANDLFASDSSFLARDRLQAIFDRAGVKPGDTVVAYCAVGLVATSTIVAARLLGHPVLLYDGSFEDWSARR